MLLRVRSSILSLIASACLVSVVVKARSEAFLEGFLPELASKRRVSAISYPRAVRHSSCP
jgi:hypothetical protein